MTNEELIEKAASVLRPKKLDVFTCGDVGCAIETVQGNLYLGVCIEVMSGMGFCAEHSAIAAMITAGEYRIKRVVAVCEVDGVMHVLSPCGRCREFMHQIDAGNLDADVILDVDKVEKLSALLPYGDWFHPVGTK